MIDQFRPWPKVNRNSQHEVMLHKAAHFGRWFLVLWRWCMHHTFKFKRDTPKYWCNEEIEIVSSMVCFRSARCLWFVGRRHIHWQYSLAHLSSRIAIFAHEHILWIKFSINFCRLHTKQDICDRQKTPVCASNLCAVEQPRAQQSFACRAPTLPATRWLRGRPATAGTAEHSAEYCLSELPAIRLI